MDPHTPDPVSDHTPILVFASFEYFKHPTGRSLLLDCVMVLPLKFSSVGFGRVYPEKTVVLKKSNTTNTTNKADPEVKSVKKPRDTRTKKTPKAAFVNIPPIETPKPRKPNSANQLPVFAQENGTKKQKK